MTSRSPRDTDGGASLTAIWAVHVAAFTRLLSQMRRHFDGDLDLS